MNIRGESANLIIMDEEYKEDFNHFAVAGASPYTEPINIDKLMHRCNVIDCSKIKPVTKNYFKQIAAINTFKEYFIGQHVRIILKTKTHIKHIVQGNTIKNVPYEVLV